MHSSKCSNWGAAYVARYQPTDGEPPPDTLRQIYALETCRRSVWAWARARAGGLGGRAWVCLGACRVSERKSTWARGVDGHACLGLPRGAVYA